MNERFSAQVLIGIEALKRRSSDFDRVFRTIAAPATSRWLGLQVWMKTHPEWEPWGIVLERDGNVVAVAVLTRYRRLGVWRIGKPGGAFDEVRFGYLDDDAAKKLAEAICDALSSFGGHWILDIADLPSPPDPTVAAFLSYWPYSQTYPQPPIPSLLFEPSASLNKYLSHNTRAAVAKARNRIKREHRGLSLEWTCELARIVDLLPEILDIYHDRDHQIRGQSLIDDPKAREFFVWFVTEHSRLGLIDLLTIRIERQLAAFALCLLEEGMHSVLVNRVSPRWLHYSAGTIANAEVVRHAFEDPRSRGINWRGPPQRYKLSGEVTLIPYLQLRAWSSLVVRVLCQLSRVVRRLGQYRVPTRFV